MFRTRLTLLVVAILVATSTQPAEAVDLKVAAKSAVSGFQRSLNATLDAMNALEDEHAKNTAEINEIGLLAASKISATLQTDLALLASQYSPKLEDEHAKNTAEINQVGLLVATKISTTLQTDLVSLASQYNPQIAASNSALTAAKAKWETVNTLKIQDGFGFNGSSQAAAIKYFLCPPSTLPNGPTWLEIVKRTCNGATNPLFGARSTKGVAGSTIGGEDWQKNEIGTLNTWDFGKDLEAVIADGYMVAVNPADFDSTRLTIKSETTNFASLTAIYSKARLDAHTKSDNATSAAKSATASALAFENNRYEQATAIYVKAKLDAQAKSEKAMVVTNTATANALAFEDNRYEQAMKDLELKQAQAESFILAAKRASKDYKTFNKAFTTALQFEYNRIMLGRVADAPWTAFTSLRSLSSLVKVIALADLADATASRYTMANAAKLNASVGNTFTKDPSFSASLKTSKALYSKVIKT
jgi:hypothetical protein